MVASSLLSGLPFQVTRLRTGEACALVRSVIDNHATRLVVANTASMAALIPNGVTSPVVIDTHNVDSLVATRYSATLQSPAQRIAALVNARQFRRLERALSDRVSEWWTCSIDDARELDRVTGGVKVLTIPNGVDTTLFSDRGGGRRDGEVVFFGRLDYKPNADAVAWLLRDIWPRVRAAVPSASLRIIGAGNTSLLRPLFAGDRGAELVGFTPDVAGAVARASACVVPLRMGGGTRLKILEAFAAGTPVVTTRVGAEGIDFADGVHAMVADDAVGIADALVVLLRDPGRRWSLARAARRLVEERYAWNSIEAVVAARAAALIESTS